MQPVVLTAGVLVVLVVLVVALVLGLGRGSWRRGTVRLVRRLRAARRRVLKPGMGRARSMVRRAWIRQVRRGVGVQLRRLADRIERVGAGAADLVGARTELGRHVSELRDISPARSPAAGGVREERVRRTGSGRDWLVAVFLAVAGLALAAANVWLLTDLVLPYLPASFAVERTMTIPVAVSSLAFVLGLVYFSFGSFAGLGGRVFRWATWLLIALLSVAEGYAAVTALQGSGVVALTWWGGIAVAAFLGGAGGLVPAVIAATSHAAVERLEQWLSARGFREARNALNEQSATVDRVTQTLDRMEGRVTALRAELTALSAGEAGRLLMSGDQASVERLTHVLRRLARIVEADPAGLADTDAGPIKHGLGLVRDLLVLALWLLSSAAVLSLAVPAIAGLGNEAGPLLRIAMAAGFGLLLVMGAVLRWILSEIPLEKSTPLRGALVLVTGLVAAAAGIALGPAVADTGALDAGAPQAGAWLVLLVLVAAGTSTGLGRGVSSLGSVIMVILGAVAWLLLGAADAALGGLDFLLTGDRRPGGPSAGSDSSGDHSGGELG